MVFLWQSSRRISFPAIMQLAPAGTWQGQVLPGLEVLISPRIGAALPGEFGETIFTSIH